MREMKDPDPVPKKNCKVGSGPESGYVMTRPVGFRSGSEMTRKIVSGSRSGSTTLVKNIKFLLFF